MPETAHELTVPLELLIEAATGYNEPEPTDTYVRIMRIPFIRYTEAMFRMSRVL